MFKILVGNQVIFDDIAPIEGLKVIEPKLTLEENAAGSLTFKLPPDNVGYNSIYCLKSEVIVTQDEVEIWRGRVISEEVDFWKCKKYMCEGELAYLNDTIQPPKRYLTSAAPATPEANTVYSTNIRSFLNNLLNTHNSQVGGSSNKCFLIGGVTVDDGDTLDDSDAINRFTNYETTLRCINEKVVDKLGGHIRLRHSGGNRYFDYFKDYSEIGASDQTIRFGLNLLDYVQNLDSVDWVTAVVPKGKRLELDESAQPVKGLEAYTNVTTAAVDGTWHTSGSMFVVNQQMVSQYGFISAVVDFDEVTDVNILKNKAKKYLQSVVFDQLCLEISAVDLHYLNPQIETLKLQETVRCISDPHGMDTSFPVTKIEIDMVNPTNTTYTLGTKVSTTLTSAQNRANDELRNYVEDTFIPTESKVLNSAKANATSLINGAAAGGFASWIYGLDRDTGNADINQTAATPKTPTGIRVANAKLDENATNRWLWTTGGLGHYSRQNTSTLWKNVAVNTAITMDGKIVADFLTAGMIKLTGATTQKYNNHESNKTDGWRFKTYMKVYDTVNNVETEIGHWGSDGIWIGKGSIDLGTKTSQTINNKTGNFGIFHVDTDGFMSLKKGSIDLGTKSQQTINGVTGSFGVFHVDDNGFMSLTKGSIDLGTKSSQTIHYKDGNNNWQTKTGNFGVFHVDDAGIMSLTKGSIDLGPKLNKTINGRTGNFGVFHVDDDGFMSLSKGQITMGEYNGNGYGSYKRAWGSWETAYYPVIINDNGDTFFNNIKAVGDIIATSGYIGDWIISNGEMNITDGASAKLSKHKIGCGYAGGGIVNIRGNTRYDDNIDSGGQEDWSSDKKYGFIQISNSGTPDKCVEGIRIFGNGHIVWYDGDGDAYRDRYLSNIDEG